jgi:hypothetical protein
VLVIQRRIAHRLADDDLSGKMHDCVERMRFQRRFNRARIAKIADNQITPAHCFAMSVGQIVEHDDAKSALGELLAHVGADIAGAAAD